MSFSIQKKLFPIDGDIFDHFYPLWLSTSFLVIAIIFFLIIFTARSKRAEIISDFWWVSIAALALFVLRLPTFSYSQSNPDEGQWLSSVITLDHNFYQYFFDFYGYDFSRSMTIFPLYLLNLFGFEVDFSLAKFTGILFLKISMAVCYFFIQDLFDKKTAILCALILSVYLGTTSQLDYIAYNSEMPSSTFLLMFVMFFYKSLKNNEKALPFLSGLFAILSLFAKEQSAYIVFFCGMLCLCFYIFNKRYWQAGSFVSGGLCVISILMAPFLIFNEWQPIFDFTKTVSVYMEYSVGQTLLEKLDFIYINNNPGYYLLPFASLLLLACFSLARRKLVYYANYHRVIFSLLLLFYMCSLFTVLSPHKFYVHYSIFIIFPSIFILAFFIFLSRDLADKKTFSVMCATLFLLIVRPDFDVVESKARLNERIGTTIMENAELPGMLLRYAKPGDRMMVWGWDCSLFVKTGLIRGSRYWYPQFLQESYPDDFRENVVSVYERDIRNYRPVLIVQLMHNDWRYIPPIEDYPSVNELINQNYILVESGDRYKIFVSRSVL